ncbi:hypothetical protein [Bradyrhizobium betae]|uniref:Uncharacterized protein n=1 Tax=Bradyrhizobium betae TaxID=244734 RepID=A0A5P6PDC3_9BRAD|nr:hypothetical protein [Bradyrhizobium betae]MCS3726486.1 hypothetical protein [Bradyrhizobium betae]QFI75513.1 hypothetical protein F8237_25835 [Bradyrhizobium betae]
MPLPKTQAVSAERIVVDRNERDILEVRLMLDRHQGIISHGLEVDRVVLRILLLQLGLMRGERGVDLARARMANSFGSGGGCGGRGLLQQASEPRDFNLDASSHTITILLASPCTDVLYFHAIPSSSESAGAVRSKTTIACFPINACKVLRGA